MSGEVLKYVGFLLMVVDHANRYLWSGAHPWMEQAGRFVFPIFALILGWGMRGFDGGRRAWLTLWPTLWIALVAELAALPLLLEGLRPAWQGNVLWTLAGGCALIWVSQVRLPYPWDVAQFGLRVVVWTGVLTASVFVEYGAVGVLLVYAAWSMRMWLLLLCLGLLSVSQLTVIPLLALGFVIAVSWWCGDQKLVSPRRLFAWLYVGQFAVFSAIVALGA